MIDMKEIYDHYVSSGYNNLIGEKVDKEQQFKFLIMFLNNTDDLTVERLMEDNYSLLEERRKKYNFSSIEEMITLYRAKFYLLGTDSGFNIMKSAIEIQSAANMIYDNSKKNGPEWMVVSPDIADVLEDLDD